MRQAGQSWWWLSAGTGFPHSGQIWVLFILRRPYAPGAERYKLGSKSEAYPYAKRSNTPKTRLSEALPASWEITGDRANQ